MNDGTPGIQDAANDLHALREQYHALYVTAHWNTQHGRMTVVVNTHGTELFHNGRAVPMKQAQR
jgi:hypothetical protein